MAAAPENTRPSFDELPFREGDPPFAAWGPYGDEDQLGTLNLLTPNTVAEAAKEIKTGVRVGLNLPLNIPSPGSHNRFFKHEVIHKAPRAVHDDVVHLNTQCSTQWDGFRHYGYQKSKLFYNGHKAEDFQTHEGRLLNGVHAWCSRGIAGRGILLDYAAWAKKQNIQYRVFEDHPVPVSALQSMAQDQGVEFRKGDILLVRIGWKQSYLGLSVGERNALPHRTPVRIAGIEPSTETARWLWDTGFSVCGTDTTGFEMWPLNASDPNNGAEGMHLHEVMLGGWGMPIGGLLDLDDISLERQKQGRWSFFLTSMPLNTPGGCSKSGKPIGNLLARNRYKTGTRHSIIRSSKLVFVWRF